MQYGISLEDIWVIRVDKTQISENRSKQVEWDKPCWYRAHRSRGKNMSPGARK